MNAAFFFPLILFTLLLQEPPDGIYSVGNGVSAPQLIRRVEPEYSETARRAGLQGTALLIGVVDRDGHIESLLLARGLGLGLDQKALEAVEQWQFKPGLRFGQPVRVRVQIEVTFRLLRGREEVEKLRIGAENGDPISQLRLGALGGPEAVRWYRAAAEQGEGAAQTLLGLAYEQGQGVEADPLQAYLWLSLAAQSRTEGAAEDLERVSRKMTQEQLAQVQEMVRNWRKRLPRNGFGTATTTFQSGIYRLE